MAADTIIHRFLEQAEIRPNSPGYHTKVDGVWKATSWKEYVAQTRTVARALLALGVGKKPGDADGSASCVCILGFNCPEWTITDLATMMIGGAPAGIYTTCSPAEVAYIVAHTEAKVVLVENLTQLEKVRERRAELPHLETIVLMQGVEAPAGDDSILTWEAFLDKASEVSDAVLQEHIDALRPDDLATLIYTSGTTGPPKGVMLSHRNLAWTAQCAADMVPDINANDSVISYLPLSHIAEQMFTLHVPATTGVQVYFAESVEKLPDNFKEVQPTILFGVPRIWEKFYAGVTAKLAEASGFRAQMAKWAQECGREVNELRNRSEEPTGWLALKYAFFAKKVFGPVKEKLGLSRAKLCVSGAAPISPEILKFFGGLDIVIHEVYGQSEDCGPTSFNVPGRTKFGSVGPAIPGVEVKIGEDDEILVKGPNVFLGYYKDPAATAETLKDGWLYSGDLGRVDGEGFLHITGRKKDLIITAGGKNVAPKNIEAPIKDHPLVGEAVVVGDRRKFLAALISLDPEASAKFAQEHGISPNELADSPQLRGVLQELIDKVNRDLARVEQVKKFCVVSRPFSIEGGELTPTLKVKRQAVSENYAAEIEAMYAEDERPRPTAKTA